VRITAIALPRIFPQQVQSTEIAWHVVWAMGVFEKPFNLVKDVKWLWAHDASGDTERHASRQDYRSYQKNMFGKMLHEI
jgi:hypothetical protein